MRDREPSDRRRDPADPDVADPDGRFSHRLESWLSNDSPKTLGDLAAAFREKSFAVLVLVLMFPAALPLPTAGITHVFEALTAGIAMQMIVGRTTVWLPRRWRDRDLRATTLQKAIPFILRRIRSVERFSRPRGSRLMQTSTANRGVGVLFVVLAAFAATAPPFSGLDTLPALGAVLVALAVILEDLAVLGVGILVGSGGVVAIFTVGAGVLRLVRSLL
jgi:hypothetical protein